MEKIVSRIRTSAAVIRNLPELPGYNGSILMIDDDEAERIEADLSDCVSELESKAPIKHSDQQADGSFHYYVVFSDAAPWDASDHERIRCATEDDADKLIKLMKP